MKNLIFINGASGVGKTTTSKILLKILPNCVFLDGDWCWDANPFVVNDETKCMVENNIAYLLNSFLTCSAYENIIFCWVMHEESIIEKILSLIQTNAYSLYKFSLISSVKVLTARLKKDIESGARDNSIIYNLERTFQRLPNYLTMNTTKIDVNDITPDKAAEAIYTHIYRTK